MLKLVRRARREKRKPTDIANRKLDKKVLFTHGADPDTDGKEE